MYGKVGERLQPVATPEVMRRYLVQIDLLESSQAGQVPVPRAKGIYDYVTHGCFLHDLLARTSELSRLDSVPSRGCKHWWQSKANHAPAPITRPDMSNMVPT